MSKEGYDFVGSQTEQSNTENSWKFETECINISKDICLKKIWFFLTK